MVICWGGKIGAAAYEVVEREKHILNVRVFAVQEIVDGKLVCLVHVLGSRDGLEHGADDDVRVDYGEIESRILLFEEIPCGLLS